MKNKGLLVVFAWGALAACSSAGGGKTADSAAKDVGGLERPPGDLAVTPAVDLAVPGPDASPDRLAADVAPADSRAGADAGTVDRGPPDAPADLAARDAAADIAMPADAADGPADTTAAVDRAAADQASADAAVDMGPDTGVGDAPPARCGRINCDCTFKGIRLWGKVQYVGAGGFPDIKVKESSFPDLKVRDTPFPSSCGDWQDVGATGFPDFKVQKVDFFEDVAIQYSPFPGIP